MQNDNKIFKSTAEKVKKWRKNVKSKIVASLGGECICCGYNKCYDALELHHINPENKDFSFGSIRANPKSWNKIVNEIKKCLLVCANCHREIHNGMTKIPSSIPVFDERYSDYNFGLEKDKCPICNEYKELRYRTCSKKCAGKLSWSIDWTKFDLVDLFIVKKMLVSEVELLIGVSMAAIKKKAKSLGLIITNNKKIIKKPSKEELEKIVLEKPMSQIARYYGVVSDNTIRKWCLGYGIDYKKISRFSRMNREARPKMPHRVFPSKYNYVTFDSKRNQWCANIKVSPNRERLFKRYDYELEAAQAVANHLKSTELILR